MGEGDPTNTWWQGFHDRLRGLSPTDQQHQWLIAARKIASEFQYWKNEYLPAKMQASQSLQGVLLVDRSLISRISLAKEFRPLCRLGQLYADPGGEDSTWRQLLPDRIISLEVSQTTLLSRLDQNDPKFGFRERLIRSCYTHHRQIVSSLPMVLRCITYPVDGDRPPERVAATIRSICLPMLHLDQLCPAV